MKVLITGGVGMLGSNLAKTLIEQNHEVIITYNDNEPFFEVKAYKIDIRDGKVKELIESVSPEWVIHTAAITNVDLCETDRELAYSVNVNGTKNVIDGCKKAGSNLVFVSTSFVFDSSREKYSEEDKTNPINYYAKTKIEAEELTKNSELHWIIVRPDQIYCWHPFKRNFITSTLEKFNKKKEFSIFDDWYSSPTYASDLAKIIITLIEKNEKGIFNTSGPNYLNRFQWAQKIGNVFEKDASLVIASKSTEVNLPAKRPNVKLDLSKIEKVLGRKTIGIEEGLSIMKKEKGDSN